MSGRPNFEAKWIPVSPVRVFKIDPEQNLNWWQGVKRNVFFRVFFTKSHYFNLKCSYCLMGKGPERRKSLRQKSKKEHRKSKSWLIDQNVESIFKVDKNIESDKNRSWSERQKWQLSSAWSERRKSERRKERRKSKIIKKHFRCSEILWRHR